MTPPDAMSWDEAVAALEAATPEIVGRAERAEHKRALAAIQSHRVQAEADAAALQAMSWPGTCAGLLAIHVLSHFVLPTENSKAICIDWAEKTKAALAKAEPVVDAALAAAANNDGGVK